MTIETILKTLIIMNIKNIQVEIKGIESNRDVMLRILQSSILNIISIRGVTTKFHNGCKKL